MFNKVAGTTDLLLAVTMIALSVILLVTSLIMGLKIRWWRARKYDIQASKGSSEPTTFAGMYRGQSFEVASAAPKVRQTDNATASSSSYKFQQPSSLKQLLPSSLSYHKFKTDSQKKYSVSSFENPPVGQSQPSKQHQKNSEAKKTETKNTHGTNPLSEPRNPPAFATMGQSQPSGSERDSIDRNKSKHQSATTKNPLATLDRHYEHFNAEKPSQSMGQNMKPNSEVPVPKGTLLKAKLQPPPVTHDDNSSVLKLTDNSSTLLKVLDDNHKSFQLTDDYHTSPKLTNDNRTSRRDIEDNHVSPRPGHGGSTAFKSKVPIPLQVTEEDVSESET